ncbi:crotonase/enoyl-CoA hydratase family protein [Streptomyces griseorubiginosus]|uniref:crotonase/enoyl-CoA hydratase family protein n=1 Tax=Streptomyces griseorubiginosus TaxID=67304 RepID=UPI001AD69DD4|nr:crotonase/enoyl-CoA hydratase family protein [Streptomyces griseorubiginosus]MBO4256220.1 crotonase/enoyl-CoA hydratase family protein [Streptomyces griseorubiginosus]
MDDAVPRLLTERPKPHIVVITINRFERRNAFDRATALAMEEAIDTFEQDPDLRVAVITGAGGTFCAGQDLIAAVDGDLALSDRRGGFGIITERPNKPVIAAVEGYALAGGLELCLACDLIVASSDAVLGIPEAAKALVAIGGGLLRLPKRIPYHLAMELALTGDHWPATEFHRLGLINRLTPPGQALSAALELAERVAASGPAAVRASVQVVRRAYDWPEPQAWELQDELVKPALEAEDRNEGLLAFAEKRQPIWTGR